ncbi:MAG: hypothetical protein LQ338_008355 [Usnochroma carphineum]|nr:MAG: hypothetical protein LQ338_008355 [Usnochroma carphineum]
MSAGFGFSVGDIVAFLKLIKQSIEALQDTKGSTADFQGLSHDIDSLKDGLEAVADLKLEQRLGVKSQSFEQSAQQENQQQVALESHSKGLDLHLNQATALLVGLTLDQRQLFQSVLENNQRMTHELHEMRGAVQLQLELPPQVILQKPVTLLDACGEVSAFYLDFINCAEAFLAVLKIRFQRLGVEERGVRMLDDSKFVLEDFRGRLDLTKPWSQIMRPSQKIDMSMIFHRGLPWSVCPACQKENQVDFESGTEW